MYDDAYTRDNNGKLAVRTVSVTEGAVSSSYDDIFTRDTEGKLAMRVVNEGGGGGGSVDTSTVVNKAAILPEATANNVNDVYMYDGADNENYTRGYIYQNQHVPSYTGTVSFESATISGTTVACSGDNFANFLTESGVSPLSVVSGTMTYDAASALWVLVGKDANDETVLTFQEYQQDFVDAGFTFTGTPENGDVVAFTCTVEDDGGYAWARINVQPQGGSGTTNYNDLTNKPAIDGITLTSSSTKSSLGLSSTTFRVWGANE